MGTLFVLVPPSPTHTGEQACRSFFILVDGNDYFGQTQTIFDNIPSTILYSKAKFIPHIANMNINIHIRLRSSMPPRGPAEGVHIFIPFFGFERVYP